MKVHLFLDEDVHSGLAHALRKRGYDAVHAQELDKKGRSDLEQILLAAEQERCFFYLQCQRFRDSTQPPFKRQVSALGHYCLQTASIQRNDVKAVKSASAYP
jgi:hypothetical protein